MSVVEGAHEDDPQFQPPPSYEAATSSPQHLPLPIPPTPISRPTTPNGYRSPTPPRGQSPAPLHQPSPIPSRLNSPHLRSPISPRSRQHTPQPSSGSSTASFPSIYSPTLASDHKPLEISEAYDHLRLLGAFHRLHTEIVETQGLFGHDSDDTDRDHKRRWGTYVHRAVDRFERWWQKAWEAEPLTYNKLNETLTACGGSFLGKHYPGSEGLEEPRGQPREFRKDTLPPLDVIFIWYTMLQNPRALLTDTLRHGKQDFWATPLPVDVIISCIDDKTFEYRPAASAKHNWIQLTGMAWDNLDLPEKKRVHCPQCEKPMDIPWTMPASDRGYADPHFLTTCETFGCGATINLATLSCANFVRDLKALHHNGVLLHSILLDKHGRIAEQNRVYQTSDMMYPNRLFQRHATQVETFLSATPNATLADIRNFCRELHEHIDLGVKGARVFAPGETINLRFTGYHTAKNQTYLKEVLERYDNNLSPFTISPVLAALKQTIFLTQTATIFPAFHRTPLALRLLQPTTLQAYHNLFALHAENPHATLVPTLVLDLLLQSHLAAPRRYYRFSVAATRRLVAHATPLTPGAMANAWLHTCQLWDEKFGSFYSNCNCGFCLATTGFHRSRWTQRKWVKTMPEDTGRGGHVSSQGMRARGVEKVDRGALWRRVRENAEKVGVAQGEGVLEEALLAGALDWGEEWEEGEEGVRREAKGFEWRDLALGIINTMIPVDD